jgi:hypothetical protein
MKINSKLQEANDDFTRRMDAMEKRLQRTASEKEALLEENKVASLDIFVQLIDCFNDLPNLQKLNQESATRISQRELSDLINEKDDEIKELRREGESLSKQVGKHSEVIKKLRGKEKSNEAELKTLKSELEDRRKECER